MWRCQAQRLSQCSRVRKELLDRSELAKKDRLLLLQRKPHLPLKAGAMQETIKSSTSSWRVARNGKGGTQLHAEARIHTYALELHSRGHFKSQQEELHAATTPLELPSRYYVCCFVRKALRVTQKQASW